MSTLAKLQAHIQRWGWRRTAYAIVMRAASRLIGLEIFVLRIRDTPEQGLASLCELPDISFGLISDEELLTAVEDVALPLHEDFVRPAIDRGDLAFGAFHEGSLIAYAWRSTSTAPHYDDCWVRVERPYSYSYNSYARPDFRGQHIVPALIMYSDYEMRKVGFTHRTGIVGIANFPSRAMRKHMDSHNIGHVGFLNWFGRYLFFRSGSAKEIGFQFFQPSRLQSSDEDSSRKSST